MLSENLSRLRGETWTSDLSLEQRMCLLCIPCMCLLGIHPIIVECKHEKELKCCKSKTFPNFFGVQKLSTVTQNKMVELIWKLV